MHRGEVATLICGPQYAFGEAGAPPKIPPDATVETQLELVDWLDLAATYNAVPGKVETDEELRDRWGKDLAAGTSPMKDEAGGNLVQIDEEGWGGGGALSVLSQTVLGGSRNWPVTDVYFSSLG